MEEVRGKRDEGRWMRDEGRRKTEDGRGKMLLVPLFPDGTVLIS